MKPVGMVNSKYPGGREAAMKGVQRSAGGKRARVRLAKGCVSCPRRGPRSLHAVRYLPRRLTWEPSLSSGRMPISCAHSISHAETFVFFVLGQRDDGIRVTSKYAAFHKVPSRGALQSFIGDFTARGGKVLSADIDAVTAVETSSNRPRKKWGLHPIRAFCRRRLGLFRGGTMIATDGVGPPGPEMRSPSGKLGRREVSIERATIDIYAAAAQLSSVLSLGQRVTLAPRKEGTCR